MTIDNTQLNQPVTVTDATNSPGHGGSDVKRIIDRQILRQQAEKIFAEKTANSKENFPPSPDEMLELLHELQVHQIELEMQNEELRLFYAKLEAAQIRYFDLYDLAPVGYFTINEQEVVLDANLTAASLLGLPRGKLVNQPISRFICKEDQDIYYLHRKQLRGIGEPQTCELRMTGKAETVFWAELTTLAAQDTDGTVIYRIVLRDNTKNKQAEKENAKLEAQLQQAQKMESVGQLAGGAAHDFNNMLGVILGHAEMAMDQMSPDVPLYNDLDEIRRAAERSAGITRQLLAFARRQTVLPEALDLNDTVEGMLKMLRRLIGEDIELAWLPGDDLWQIKMDPSQIDQILANLCVNSRDAITGVGKITVETGNNRFDSTYRGNLSGILDGDYIHIAMHDSGCGMDKETQTHIFEPFFTTKGIGKGTGLGLSTVYGIVKQNNGFINASSELGQGTTFTIYLPRCENTIGHGQPEEIPGNVATGGNETILLVEDEPTILKMTTTMLHRLGYAVLAAQTPEEALRLARESPLEIHLLITDVIMPEMNGRDLAKQLLASKPEMKCLFMSGYSAKIIASHGVLDEALSFIQKPFSKKRLAVKVREVLKS